MAKVELNIIHFNDVYDIREKTSEPVGGLARFATAVKSFADKNPILLFSGDAYNPSIMSTITKGKHMNSVLNHLKVACSVIGNHEFDFGVDTAAKYIAECNFPWLLSNVNDKAGQPIVGAKRTALIDWNGVKVGLFGLAELEWLDTVRTVLKEVDYIDYVVAGKDLVKQLKDQGADVIIALTHMRSSTAQDTADKVPGIDLVLNGHDHFYEVATVKGIKVVTSGVDFKDLSFISMIKNPGDTNFTVTVEEIHVTSKYERDAEAQQLADSFNALIDKKLLKEIGETTVVLDASTDTVRTRESNMGNLVADIMKAELKTKIAFINGGSIRSDATYGPGPILVADLMNIFPFTNVIVSFSLTGAQLKTVLEVSVGKWPDQVGRFLQVSGIKFGFDPTKPAGSRVDWVQVKNAPLDLDRVYTACTTYYIAEGNDGFDACLGPKNIKYIVNEENGVMLASIVRRHFIRMKTMQTVGTAVSNFIGMLAKKQLQQQTGKKIPLFNVSPSVQGRIVNLSKK